MPSISTTTRHRRHRTSRYADPRGELIDHLAIGFGQPATAAHGLAKSSSFSERTPSATSRMTARRSAVACRAAPGRARLATASIVVSRCWTGRPAAAHASRSVRAHRRRLHGRDLRSCPRDTGGRRTSSSLHRRVSWTRTPAVVETGVTTSARHVSPSSAMPSRPAACSAVMPHERRRAVDAACGAHWTRATSWRSPAQRLRRPSPGSSLDPARTAARPATRDLSHLGAVAHESVFLPSGRHRSATSSASSCAAVTPRPRIWGG